MSNKVGKNGDGVIRIGRKGIKQFAFGNEGKPFEIDVVVTMQEWFGLDEGMRQKDGEYKGQVLTEDMAAYHKMAVKFVSELAIDPTTGEAPTITTAEALDFLARLREQYDELVDFFRPKRRKEEESPGTSEAELRFSVEEEPSPSSIS